MKSNSKKYEPCLDPFIIKRTITNLATGEITNQEFEKRCGTRRQDKCKPCSVIWKDDAYFALINPSKEFRGTLTFITLTPPGAKHFGATHTASYKGLKSERCACRRFHEPKDEILGIPINQDTFKYSEVVDFNNKASRLTAITMQKIYRLLVTDINSKVKTLSATKELKDVRLPTARVMEFQIRGVLHTHILVRGFIPSYIIEMAVNGAPPSNKRRRVLPAQHKGQRWGTQVDVKHINSGDEAQLKKLGSYVTKVVSYALKDVTAHGQEKNKAREYFHQKLRKQTNRIVICKKTATECDASPRRTAIDIVARPNNKSLNFCVKHRRAHHQLGFSGNILTMSRSWESSLKKAREARFAYANGSVGRTAVKAVRFNTEKKLVTHLVIRKRFLIDKTILASLKIAPTVIRSGINIPSQT